MKLNNAKMAKWIIKASAITLDIEEGDTLLFGRYKNSPHVVKEIGTDEKGQPTVNGMKLLACRIKKNMDKKAQAADLASILRGEQGLGEEELYDTLKLKGINPDVTRSAFEITEDCIRQNLSKWKKLKLLPSIIQDKQPEFVPRFLDTLEREPEYNLDIGSFTNRYKDMGPDFTNRIKRVASRLLQDI